MNLYEITATYSQALELIDEDGVLTDEALEIIEKSELALENKADNIAKVLQNFENSIDFIKTEIDRLNAKKKSLENNHEKLKKYLSEAMQKLKKTKIKTDLFDFSFRKSNSVEITDETEIEEKYKFAKIDIKIDKKAIMSDLKKGEEVKGAIIVEKQNLQIK